MIMRVMDFNGEGNWSKDGIFQRYMSYCCRAGIEAPLDLSPRVYVGKNAAGEEATWIYPVMDRVIEGIKEGDVACKWLGLDFIEQDAKFPFGRILKSNVARALRRREDLTEAECERIRVRIVNMLLAGQVPHEYHAYAKLLRRVGVGLHWPEIERGVNRANRYVMRWYDYLKRS